MSADKSNFNDPQEFYKASYSGFGKTKINAANPSPTGEYYHVLECVTDCTVTYDNKLTDKEKERGVRFKEALGWSETLVAGQTTFGSITNVVVVGGEVVGHLLGYKL